MAKLKALTVKMIDKVCIEDKEVKLGHNTWLVKTSRGYGIRYHHTVVVEFLSKVLIRLDSNGWKTSSTKQRINGYIPGCIYQVKHEWFLVSKNQEDREFFDGICLTADVPHYYPEFNNAQITNEN